VCFERVEAFIVEIGRNEEAIFQKRMRLMQRQKVRSGGSSSKSSGRPAVPLCCLA
jgi:hypothetical protein